MEVKSEKPKVDKDKEEKDKKNPAGIRRPKQGRKFKK